MNNNSKKPAIIAIVILIAFCAGYQQLITKSIRSLFQKNGFDNITFNVDSAGFNEAKFSHITLGDDNPLKIGEAQLGYSLLGLWNHHIDSLTIDTLVIDANILNGKVSLHGLDSAIMEYIPSESTMIFPDYFFHPQTFFFNSLTIKNATLHIKGENTDLLLPFNMEVHNGVIDKIIFDSGALSGTLLGYSVAVPKISTVLTLSSKYKWSGEWEADNITVNSESGSLAGISTAGALTVYPSSFNLGINLKTAPPLIDGTGELQVKNRNAALAIKKGHFSWGQGDLGINNVTLLLAKKAAFNFTIDFKHLDISELSPLFLGNDASGTGFLSGTINAGFSHTGNLLFYQGSVGSNTAGTICIPPHTIAMPKLQGKDLKLLSKELCTFHFNTLKMGIQAKGPDNFLINLIMDGTNPVQSHGQPLNIKAAINGDTTKLQEKILNLYPKQQKPPAPKPL